MKNKTAGRFEQAVRRAFTDWLIRFYVWDEKVVRSRFPKVDAAGARVARRKK